MAKMRIETEGFTSTIANIHRKREQVVVAVRDTQEGMAEELKKEVERTAPVDTGRYRDGWETEERGEVWYLKNDVPYAPYLVFPNSKFVGSPHADKPSKGILHNVRGIVHGRKHRYKAKMIAKVRGALSL